MGASGELAVTRFSTIGCGERLLKRITITPATATRASAISRRRQGTYLGVELSLTCGSGCIGSAGTLVAEAGPSLLTTASPAVLVTGARNRYPRLAAVSI